jgi:hypothetical protein
MFQPSDPQWRLKFPSTFQPVPPQHGVRQPRTFDPALKHLTNAYRAGEPSFDDERVGLRWRSARRTAMDHILACVAASPSVEHLVLRGSVLLRVWLGDAAREPGDLDWVVMPPTVSLNHWQGLRLLDGVIDAVRADPRTASGVTIDADGVAVEDIWTYERAPGRRLVIPWTAPDVSPGYVQLDFVFNEQLPAPPILIEFPRPDAAATVLWAAGPELSLAWKILWLETDWYPQGKDLYDATLLAEYTPLPLDLLRAALARELGEEASLFTAESVLRWRVDWKNFQDEYPWVEGDLPTWKARLVRALGPTFR